MLWLSLALAGPGQSGSLFPGARPLNATGFAGVGGIVGNVEGLGRAGGATVDFGVGREVALIGHADTWSIQNGSSGAIAALALRAQLANTDTVRVAGLMGAALVKDGRLHFIPALALEVGREKVLFDLTLMPWSIGYRYGAPTWIDQKPRGRARIGESRNSRWSHGGIWPLGSVGVAIPVPLGADNRVRFGFPELMAWHHEGEHVYFDFGGVLVGGTFGPHAKVGFLLGGKQAH